MDGFNESLQYKMIHRIVVTFNILKSMLCSSDSMLHPALFVNKKNSLIRILFLYACLRGKFSFLQPLDVMSTTCCNFYFSPRRRVNCETILRTQFVWFGIIPTHITVYIIIPHATVVFKKFYLFSKKTLVSCVSSVRNNFCRYYSPRITSHDEIGAVFFLIATFRNSKRKIVWTRLAYRDYETYVSRNCSRNMYHHLPLRKEKEFTSQLGIGRIQWTTLKCDGTIPHGASEKCLNIRNFPFSHSLARVHAFSLSLFFLLHSALLAIFARNAGNWVLSRR